MAKVLIKGVYMGASLKQARGRDGQPGKMSCMLDLYQPDSPLSNKMVSIKCEEPEMKQYFEENYIPMAGNLVTIEATINAYNNEAYFKFVSDCSKQAVS